jgi:hypothetical protein
MGYPLATIIYDATPPVIGSTFPAGSSGAPTPINPGTLYMVSAQVSDNIDDALYLTVSCSVSHGSPASLTLSYADPTHDHRAQWTSPSLAGAIITFTFTAKDLTGNTATKTTYAVTGSPTADFYINGIKVTESSIIRVMSPALSFKVTVTSLPDLVSSASVKVAMGTNAVTLATTKSGVDYTASHSLGWGQGTYTITATMTDTSAKTYTLAVLTVPYGDMSEPVAWERFLNVFTVTGAGLMLLSYMRRKRR